MVVETQDATDDVSVRLREQLLETAAQLEQARTRHRCVVMTLLFLNDSQDVVLFLGWT